MTKSIGIPEIFVLMIGTYASGTPYIAPVTPRRTRASTRH